MLELIAKYIKDASVLRKILFAAVFLSPCLPEFWSLVVQFATDGKSESSITPEQAKALAENIQMLNSSAFATDETLFKQILLLELPSARPLGIPLISVNSTCLLCGSNLLLRKDRPVPIVLYDDSRGTLPASHFHKYCSRRICPFIQYYGYYTKGGQQTCAVVYNDNWNSLPYFVSSKETAFSMDLLKRLDAEIVIGQLSYKQRADIYNHILNSNSDDQFYHNMPFSALNQRRLLDRRRLEDAHFQYAILRVAAWYNWRLSDLPLHGVANDTLLQISSTFYEAFMKKYSGHRCKAKGCGETLVIDGNMKNHRDVCFATEAGFVEYLGLPGRIKTGCSNTPDFKSRYCGLHKPTATHGTSETSDQHITPNQVGLILSKRLTRTQTHYQVAWLGKDRTTATWEPESSLPSQLIADYEAGVLREVHDITHMSCGQTVHTLASKVVVDVPSPKRPRVVDSQHISAPSGSFSLLPEQEAEPLTCNTEKDRKTRLNHHTAGVVAGVWPCGIITFLGEIFGSESKSQVYGLLHAFLHCNADTTSHIHYICYDDGCHLKRYASHSTRKGLTPTAARLSNIEIVIDKLHFKGHVDKWCHEHCNPYNFEELNEVDTEICEQTFSWLSRYARITQKMNRQHFIFYLLYVCDIHNQRQCNL